MTVGWLAAVGLSAGAAKPAAVDILNTTSPTEAIRDPVRSALDHLQLRIINLRKRTVSDRGAIAFGSQGPVLDRAQSIYTEVESAWKKGGARQGLLARIGAADGELDKLGGD